MNRRKQSVRVITLAIVAALSVFEAHAAPGPRNHHLESGTSKQQDWKAAIQAVLDAQIVAWNRGDIDGFMAGYWNSPDFVYVGNKTVTRGWKAMLDRYHQSFTAADGKTLPLGTLQLNDTQITSLGTGAALVWGTYTVVSPDRKRRGGLYTLVMRKFPEGWRTVYDRTSSEALPN